MTDTASSWKASVQSHLEGKLPTFDPNRIFSAGAFRDFNITSEARSALATHLTHVLAAGLKDLHTIYIRAQESVSPLSTPADRFFADLTSRRPILAHAADVIDGVIEDFARRFYGYVDRFINDVQREMSAIGPFAGPLQDSPTLRRLEFFRGDPHDNFFGAIEVELSCGAVWFYKPRSAAADQAVAHLLKGLAPLLEPIRLVQVPLTVDFGDHHWSLGIKKTEIETSEQLATAARDLGAFAAIAYIFNINDLHFENVMLCSPPAFIDTETSFVNTAPPHNLVQDHEISDADRISRELVRTGLLPDWQHGGSDSPWDGSPLGSHGEFELDVLDEGNMVGAWVQGSFQNKITDLALSPEQYRVTVQSPFAEGFRKAFAQMLGSKKAIARLVDDIVLPSARCVLRPTHLYIKLLEKSFHPRVLLGIQNRRDFIRECINRASEVTRALPAAVLEYEEISLTSLSIPMFHCNCKNVDLSFRGMLERCFFSEPATIEIARRLDRSTLEHLHILERCIERQFDKRFQSPRI